MAGGSADAPLLGFNSSLFGAAAHISFDSVSWGVGPEKVALTVSYLCHPLHYVQLTTSVLLVKQSFHTKVKYLGHCMYPLW